MASEKPHFKSTSSFMLHSLKRTAMIWGIVLGVLALIYCNALLADWLMEWILGPLPEKPIHGQRFGRFSLAALFFFVVPASIIGGMCWASDEDCPEKEQEKPSGSI